MNGMKDLKEHVQEFKPNFARSQFSCITFNFGPRVCTSVHTDAKNCPHSMCAITSAGQYDPSKGGHLVLHDLKMIIEFPPGSTFLVPSALLRHCNTPVGESETRYSVTQYSAGGIFRWLEYGRRTEKELRATDPSLFKKIWAERKGRWARMASMFVTLEDVRSFHGVQ